jgi:hypothetical protein
LFESYRCEYSFLCHFSSYLKIIWGCIGTSGFGRSFRVTPYIPRYEARKWIDERGDGEEEVGSSDSDVNDDSDQDEDSQEEDEDEYEGEDQEGDGEEEEEETEEETEVVKSQRGRVRIDDSSKLLK